MKRSADSDTSLARASTPRVAALRFPLLTRFYDRVMRLLVDEEALQGRLVERSGATGAHTALDIGCGTGSVTQRLASVADSRVVGLDTDLEALVIASRKADATSLDVLWCAGSADAVPFREATFDRVLSSLLLHHLTPTQKRAAMSEVRRILRIGGELHVMDWGKATGPLTRLAFLLVQLLDGFHTTAENVRGRIPGIVAGSDLVIAGSVARSRTILGVVEFLRATRHEDPSGNDGATPARGS